MKRRPALHRLHPYYDLETTNYVIRIGGQFTVDYPLPQGYTQNPISAAVAFIRMVETVKKDAGFSSPLEDFAVELVQRKAGTRRPTGRMRFYQKEMLRWTPEKGLEDVAFDI